MHVALILILNLFVQGMESQLHVIDTPVYSGWPASGRRLHIIHLRLQRERPFGARGLSGGNAGTSGETINCRAR